MGRGRPIGLDTEGIDHIIDTIFRFNQSKNNGPQRLKIQTPAPLGKKLRLLDLFCCAGGPAIGCSKAGFEVVGVDIKPQTSGSDAAST